jgi:hypothetical protein
MVGEVCGIHDQDVVVPPADGMALVGSFAVLGMSSPIHIDDPLDVEKLITDRHPIVDDGYLI